MSYSKFYATKIAHPYVEHLDADVEKNLADLVRTVEQGPWSKKQREKQKKNILPNIALYRTFIQYGIAKDEAKELVRAYSYDIAEKGHKVLAAFFHLPKFSRFFRLVMRKGMRGKEFWDSDILQDDDGTFAVDIYKCLWKDTCDYFECPEICEIFCSCDHIVFGQIKQMTFARKQTLGTEGDRCDFYFTFK